MQYNSQLPILNHYVVVVVIAVIVAQRQPLYTLYHSNEVADWAGLA